VQSVQVARRPALSDFRNRNGWKSSTDFKVLCGTDSAEKFLEKIGIFSTRYGASTVPLRDVGRCINRHPAVLMMCLAAKERKVQCDTQNRSTTTR